MAHELESAVLKVLPKGSTLDALEIRELIVAEVDRPLQRVRFRLDEGNEGAQVGEGAAEGAAGQAVFGWCTTRSADGKPLLGAVAVATARAVARKRPTEQQPSGTS